MRRNPIIAVILAFSLNSTTWAGTISGTEEGTASIGIQQIVGGQPQGFTWYDGLPAALTYIVTTDDLNPGRGSFQFSVTDSVYSIDTSSSQFYGARGYEFYQSTPTDLLGILSSGIYHAYSLQAEIGIYTIDGLSVATGWDYMKGDVFGNGFEVQGSFADPPAGVPEPSSFVLALCGLIVVYCYIWTQSMDALSKHGIPNSSTTLTGAEVCHETTSNDRVTCYPDDPLRVGITVGSECDIPNNDKMKGPSQC